MSGLPVGQTVPGLDTARTATHRQVTLAGEQFFPGMHVIAAADARDPLASPVTELRAGLLLGEVTADNTLGASIIGALTAAYDASADTVSMTVSAATAVELVRRQGSSGTFNLTGPPSAAGTVQTVTVTYSAVDTSTGVITITALTVDVDEVQTITPTVGANADCVQVITTGGTQTAGTFKLGIRDLGQPNGAILWTDTIAWSATEATQTASVQTALDDLLGSNVIVASAIPDTVTMVLTLTFSGTGATNKVHGEVSIDISALTGASTATVAITTQGGGTISAGDYTLSIVDSNGDVKTTPKIAFDANAAAINVALDDALGSTLVVATGGPMSGPTAIVLTFSGAGYAATAQTLVRVNADNLIGLDDLTVTQTTAATTLTSNDFVVGSFVQPTDGSEIIKTFMPNGFPVRVTDIDDVDRDVSLGQYLIGALVDSSQLVNWPADASLRTWVVDALRLAGAGFTFDHTHGQ